MRWPVRLIVIAFYFALTGVAGTSTAATGSLGQLLKQGVREFEAGNYLAATESFEKAELLAPDDYRIPYNRGNALMGLGRRPQAIEAYRRAAESNDPALAAKAFVQIGDVFVDSARKTLGATPEFAEPDTQTLALQELDMALTEYEAALNIEPENMAARGNIERIKIWRDNVGKIWHEKDLNAKQFKTPPLQYLEQKRKQIESYRTEIAKFPHSLDSPKKFQRMREIAAELRLICNEGKGIREMINMFFETDPPLGSPGAIEEMGAVNALCEKIENSLRSTASRLEKRELDSEFGDLAAALRELNTLQSLLNSYETILRDAIAVQEKLVPAAANTNSTPEDAARKSWGQGTLARSIPSLHTRALQGLKFIDENPPSAVGFDPSLPAYNEMAAAIAAEIAYFEKLKQSMQLASALAPEAELHMKNAEKEFRNGKFEDAESSAEKALEILRRIAEPLDDPPNDNPQNNNPDSDPNQSDQSNEGTDQPDDGDPESAENPESGEVDPDESEGASNNQPPPSGDDEEPENPDDTDNSGDSGDDDEYEGEKNPENPDGKNGGDEAGNDGNAGPNEIEKGPSDKEKEKIDDLIRQVRRRQQEAERRREEYRKMIENRNRDNIKDW